MAPRRRDALDFRVAETPRRRDTTDMNPAPTPAHSPRPLKGFAMRPEGQAKGPLLGRAGRRHTPDVADVATTRTGGRAVRGSAQAPLLCSAATRRGWPGGPGGPGGTAAVHSARQTRGGEHGEHGHASRTSRYQPRLAFGCGGGEGGGHAEGHAPEQNGHGRGGAGRARLFCPKRWQAGRRRRVGVVMTCLSRVESPLDCREDHDVLFLPSACSPASYS